jgi:tetratricopeptide (TPR) repeat protein
MGKKILGRIEDYYFYDAIELYNLGQYAEAEKRLKEKQQAHNDTKIGVLLEKMAHANNLRKRGDDCAERAVEQLRLGDVQNALSEIRSAIDIYPSPRFKEIEQQVVKQQAIVESKERGHALYDDAQKMYSSGLFFESINTLQEAIRLSGDNSEYKSAYNKQVEELATKVSAQARYQLESGNYQLALNTINSILPYSPASPEVNQLHSEIIACLNKKSQKKRTVNSVIGITIGIVIVGLIWFFWQRNQEKSVFDAVLAEGTISSIETYLQNNPNSEYFDEASTKLAELKSFDSTEWANANILPSTASMQAYLDKVKGIKGKHIERATTIIDSIDWFAIEKLEDSYLFETYINSHPTSVYLPQARSKLSEQVTGSERDGILEYVSGFFTTLSNNDLESVMLYFEPITPVFGSRQNISKADLRTILETDRKTIESSSTTIDQTSFKIKKDANSNYYITFYADAYVTRVTPSREEGVEDVSTEYYSNSEWFITLNENKKITSYRYKIISEKETNQ